MRSAYALTFTERLSSALLIAPEAYEPIRRKNLLEVLAGLEPLGPDDQFTDVDDTLLAPKEIDL